MTRGNELATAETRYRCDDLTATSVSKLKIGPRHIPSTASPREGLEMKDHSSQRALLSNYFEICVVVSSACFLWCLLLATFW